jgi:hypothetical protein
MRYEPVATLNPDHTFSCYPPYDERDSVPESFWPKLVARGYKLEYGYYNSTIGLN